MPKCLHHQTTDSVDLFIAKWVPNASLKSSMEASARTVQVDDSADGSRYHLLRHTRLQSPNNQFQDVFNGHQTGNPTEFSMTIAMW